MHAWRTVGWLTAVTLTTLAGCVSVTTIGDGSQAPEIAGSGRTQRQARTDPTFHRVVLHGSGKLDVTAGATQSVTVEIDDNLQAIITTEVSDGVLTIRPRKSYKAAQPLTVTLAARDIDGVEIEGSGDATVKGVNGKSFSADISGSGSVTATGSADSASLTISGAGDADLSGLHAKQCSVTISGSGSAKVYASDSLSAQIAGSGDVLFAGSPKTVNRSVQGSGEIKPLH